MERGKFPNNESVEAAMELTHEELSEAQKVEDLFQTVIETM